MFSHETHLALAGTMAYIRMTGGRVRQLLLCFLFFCMLIFNVFDILLVI